MDESNKLALDTARNRPFLALLVVVAVLSAASVARAERSDLDLKVGSTRSSGASSSRLRSDLGWEQSFGDEAFLTKFSIHSLSLLSESREFGYALRVSPLLGLGPHFEGAPTLALEKDALRGKWLFMMGTRLSFSLWSLRFQSFVDVALNTIDEARVVRLQQQVLIPLGSGEKRKDYFGFSFQFEELLGKAAVGARESDSKMAALVFQTSIENLFD